MDSNRCRARGPNTESEKVLCTRITPEEKGTQCEFYLGCIEPSFRVNDDTVSGRPPQLDSAVEPPGTSAQKLLQSQVRLFAHFCCNRGRKHGAASGESSVSRILARVRNLDGGSSSSDPYGVQSLVDLGQ